MQLTCDYSQIPDALRDLPNWVAWQPVVRGGKATKVPINVHSSGMAAVDDPATWATLEEAIPFARRHQRGVGFVFSAADPFAGVDLDDCYDPATGALADWARFICWKLESYTEVSPSGRGVKVIVRGQVPPGRCAWNGHGLYDQRRFFTITGRRLDGYPADVEDRADRLRELHGLLFPPTPLPTPSPVIRVPSDLTDDEVIARAGEIANGAKFRRLWAGDTGGYASQSEADAALIALLHFLVGDDEDRLDRLFRRSGLMRDKWDRPDYRRRTFAKAANGPVYVPVIPGSAPWGRMQRPPDYLRHEVAS